LHHSNQSLFRKDKKPLLSKVRPVIQYDIDQKEIKRFGSAIEAEKETDISAENIAKVCRGKRTYAGGFIWKYADV